MNLSSKDNPIEFNRFLFEEIDLSSYKHKYLNNFVKRAEKGQSPLYDSSLINITENGWILIIHSEMLLIYGDNWNAKQIQEISEVFNLNKFTNFTLAGDDDLIDELILFYNPKNFKITKRRLLYHATKINVFENENVRILLGSMEELDELALMLQEYYHEEYDGLNDKEIEEMRIRVSSGIQTRTIYVLMDINEKLLSFCTVIDPDIGILFTKNEHRNKGYGKVILSYCSGFLLQKNNIVYLMTDRDNLESNYVCKKVGFNPFYNYKMIKVNHD